MKLQLLIAKLNASVEDQSDQVCQNVPRVIRETESLKQVSVKEPGPLGGLLTRHVTSSSSGGPAADDQDVRGAGRD